MYRIAIEKLFKWKQSKYRKPLIIEGARQVGKTWLMKEFGRQAYAFSNGGVVLFRPEYRSFDHGAGIVCGA